MTIPLQTIGIDAIIAFFIPLIIAIVKQAGLSSAANGLIAIACYVVFGALGVVLSGQPLTLENVAILWGIFQTIGTTAYNAFWKNTSIETTITERTSILKSGTGAPNVVPDAPPPSGGVG